MTINGFNSPATRYTDEIHSDVGFTVGDPDNPTPVGPLAAATKTVIGGVLEMPLTPNLTAAPTQTDFNNLLAALRAAGMMSST